MREQQYERSLTTVRFETEEGRMTIVDAEYVGIEHATLHHARRPVASRAVDAIEMAEPRAAQCGRARAHYAGAGYRAIRRAPEAAYRGCIVAGEPTTLRYAITSGLKSTGSRRAQRLIDQLLESGGTAADADGTATQANWTEELNTETFYSAAGELVRTIEPQSEGWQSTYSPMNTPMPVANVARARGTNPGRSARKNNKLRQGIISLISQHGWTTLPAWATAAAVWI